LRILAKETFLSLGRRKTAQTQIVGINEPGLDLSKTKLDSKKTQSRKNFPKNSDNFF
jgi:hypothetical protein